MKVTDPAPPARIHRAALPDDHEAVASDRLATVLGWCIGIAAGAAVSAVGMYVHTFGWHLSANHEVWNQAGGYFSGVLGPAFGFLSLFALLFTVMLQRELLSLGRRQLADANEGLAVSRAAYERQQFESTFFELLKLTRELISHFEIPEATYESGFSTRIGKMTTAPAKFGAAALDSYAASINKRVEDRGDVPTMTDAMRARHLVRVYRTDFYLANPSDFGPYFRCLYQTFKHISESPLSDDEKNASPTSRAARSARVRSCCSRSMV